MKKIILLFSFLGINFHLVAQDAACLPDSLYADSSLAVFPEPLDLETGEGGIEAFPACIGEPYELTFTFRLGDSASLQGFQIDLLSAKIPQVGGISGLPEGINYFCNPPSCEFADTTLGCITLQGIPTESNTIGVNKLVISATLLAEALGEYATTIPGPEIMGEYNIVIKAPGECTTTSTSEVLADTWQLSHYPNPAMQEVFFDFIAPQSDDYQLSIFDFSGKILSWQTHQLPAGANRISADVSSLAAGMYFYQLNSKQGAITQKLVVANR